MHLASSDKQQPTWNYTEQHLGVFPTVHLTTKSMADEQETCTFCEVPDPQDNKEEPTE